SMHGFADEELRPPAPIGNQPRWPISQPPPAYPQNSYSQSSYPQVPSYPSRSPSAPISLSAPGVAPDQGAIDLPADGTRAPYMSAPAYPSRDRSPSPYSERPDARDNYQPGYQQSLPPRLGPRGNPVNAVGPVAVRPAATLACPIVSVLDRWLAEAVQPAAQRWFGARVVEIKQVS